MNYLVDVESRINLDLLRYQVRIWEQWLSAGHTGPLPTTRSLGWREKMRRAGRCGMSPTGLSTRILG
jgi:hypothetical protein